LTPALGLVGFGLTWSGFDPPLWQRLLGRTRPGLKDTAELEHLFLSFSPFTAAIHPRCLPSPAAGVALPRILSRSLVNARAAGARQRRRPPVHTFLSSAAGCVAPLLELCPPAASPRVSSSAAVTHSPCHTGSPSSRRRRRPTIRAATRRRRGGGLGRGRGACCRASGRRGRRRRRSSGARRKRVGEQRSTSA